MKMSKVGNQTNSQDPQAVNSRVFVGNLNTFQCSKTDVERMFQRYGRIAGISMHKGYAFVQFTNPFDARSACLGEDARTVLGQVLDVNMVAEPKAHQTGRKRQNMAKTGNDWDYYYDSYYSTASLSAATPRLVPPPKRPRMGPPPVSRGPPLPSVRSTPVQPPTPPALDQLKTYSNPDILICGNCREMFTELQGLLDHKKTYCKLRFTCKCHTPSTKDGGPSLLCAQCKEPFSGAWQLMEHAQEAHAVSIYQLAASAEQQQEAEKEEEMKEESAPPTVKVEQSGAGDAPAACNGESVPMDQEDAQSAPPEEQEANGDGGEEPGGDRDTQHDVIQTT